MKRRFWGREGREAEGMALDKGRASGWKGKKKHEREISYRSFKGGEGNNGGKRCLPLVFAGSLFIIFLHRYKLIVNISSSRLLHFIAFPPPAHETS